MIFLYMSRVIFYCIKINVKLAKQVSTALTFKTNGTMPLTKDRHEEIILGTGDLLVQHQYTAREILRLKQAGK
jgi:hypothetical protein